MKTSVATGASAVMHGAWAREPDAAWTKTWDAALTTLAGNVKHVPDFDQLVLFEGSVYRGIWQECDPHESLAYTELSEFVKSTDGEPSLLEVAKNTHRAFFTLQRVDGQLPASVKMSGVNWGQIQMVVPIAATGWEIAKRAQDDAFLSETYNACG